MLIHGCFPALMISTGRYLLAGTAQACSGLQFHLPELRELVPAYTQFDELALEGIEWADSAGPNPPRLFP
jgi:hypothetical protein